MAAIHLGAAGCDQSPRTLRLNTPFELQGDTEFQLTIARDAPALQTRGRVVDIPVTADGTAVIPSTDYIEQGHQWNIVTPSRTYGHLDLENVDSRWRMNTREKSFPKGKSVQSVVEGSRYIITFRPTSGHSSRN